MTEPRNHWAPAQDALAAASAAPHRYDSPAAWDNGANCGGGLLQGTRAFGDAVMARFPTIITHVGGYNCRPNTASPDHTSLHGEGRAADLMVAQNGDVGQQAAVVADWCLRNAARLGLQEIIWTRMIWSSTRGFREYAGPNSHTDHIHVGLSVVTSHALPAIPPEPQAPVVSNGGGISTSAMIAAAISLTVLGAGAVWWLLREPEEPTIPTGRGGDYDAW